MANPLFDLNGKVPAATYDHLVQIDTSSFTLYDGRGNFLTASTVPMTASWAASAVSASWAPFVDNPNAVSASWASSSFSSSYAPTVTSGLTATQSWVDGATALTNSMYINNGLVISWSYQM